MNIFKDFVLFTLVILIYWVITELFTILFRFTGLPDEKARFQVISLLTGTGFTTRESEMFLSTIQRRRLARITMLFGYAFNITILSAFINVFMSVRLTQVKNIYLGILIPLTAVVIIFVVMRVPAIRAWGDNVLQKLADIIMRRRAGENTVLLVDYVMGDCIAIVNLNTVPETFAGKPLSETGLKSANGILVLLVDHPGKKAEPAGADTVFSAGDRVTVFGNYKTICESFRAREHFGQ